LRLSFFAVFSSLFSETLQRLNHELPRLSRRLTTFSCTYLDRDLGAFRRRPPSNFLRQDMYLYASSPFFNSWTKNNQTCQQPLHWTMKTHLHLKITIQTCTDADTECRHVCGCPSGCQTYQALTIN